MNKELSIEALEEMQKVAEYLKAFKQKAQWKKAKGVIIYEDYKELGKKITVALPYKKVNDLKKAIKTIKREKKHIWKKVGAGPLTLSKGEDGKPLFQIDLKMGGMKPNEATSKKLSMLFGKMQSGVELKIADQEEGAPAENDATIVDGGDDGAAAGDNPLDNNPNALAEFKSHVKTLKPELQKLQGIVANIKSNKTSADDKDLAQKISNHIEKGMSLYDQLADDVREKYKEIYTKLIDAIEKVGKVLDKLGARDEQANNDDGGAVADDSQSDSNPNALAEFQTQVKAVKPELQKLKGIVANIKSNKISAKDIDLAGTITNHIEQVMSLYEQLASETKEKYKDIYTKMIDAMEKAGKINDKLLFMDTDDDGIRNKQNEKITQEADKILAELLNS